MQEWKYVGSATAQRLSDLVEPFSYSDFVGELRQNLNLVCFHREARDGFPEFKRAVFCGNVELRLFDRFFNSPMGYRGAYFRSPESGLRANRLLVDSMAPSLIDSALAQGWDADRTWILASLATPSAKAWLAEYPGLCVQCAGEWNKSYASDLQIENARWERSAHTHAVWGCQAPAFLKIRIFGGFINATHIEWLASHKQGRANNLWEHGWA
jgi:hypothetical protein